MERTGIEPVTSGLQIRTVARPGRTRRPEWRMTTRFGTVVLDLARQG
jgi:hypothetical protein